MAAEKESARLAESVAKSMAAEEEEESEHKNKGPNVDDESEEVQGKFAFYS